MARRAKKTSRVQQRQERLEAAARVVLPDRVDACVLGGGAAGLVAATVAAERGARVVVLERDLECGRTILATGNGRCNFANVRLDPLAFHDPAFVRAVAGDAWLDDVLAFFRQSGLAWAEEAEGRLYPLSRQAASVRNVLLARARRAGVTLAPAREVTGASRTAGTYFIRFRERFSSEEKRMLGTSRVVIATGGGLSCVAADLGLKTSPARPMLCPIACDGIDLAPLDGRRVHATLTLERDGRQIASERGEVLFRDYGVSGIAAFNLSRHAAAGDVLALDLLPGVSCQEAQSRAHHTLDGLLDPVVARALRERTRTHEEAAALAKDLRLRVTGLADAGQAQVTRGGLVNEQFDPVTLEACALPGAHACGEALDVDGPCGGFNLAWAWRSGMAVGRACAPDA